MTETDTEAEAAVFTQVRDKDYTVLTCIRNGDTDVQQIKAATTLSKNEVNYSFTKLEDLGLIDVMRPTGRVERVIEGQKRVFDAPKPAHLTDKGDDYFDWTDRTADTDRYQELSRDELVRRITELEQRVDELETAVTTFQRQVQDHLSSS